MAWRCKRHRQRASPSCSDGADAFAKSGFKRLPQEGWEAQRKFLFG
jgi:hypothetical protein